MWYLTSLAVPMEGEGQKSTGGHNHAPSLKKSTLKNSDWDRLTVHGSGLGSVFYALIRFGTTTCASFLLSLFPFPTVTCAPTLVRVGAGSFLQMIRSFTHTLEQTWSTWRAQRLIICHPSSSLSWAMCFVSPRVIWGRKPDPEHPSKMLKDAFFFY